MKVIEEIPGGALLIQPKVFDDHRGYFMETYNNRLKELTGHTNFIQDNESQSNKGVARGLHFQTASFAQSKLVRVLKGAVQDVIIDLRPDSTNYGQHFSVVLSDVNKYLLFVPRGFAHGFVVLEDKSIFHYKCDNIYSPQNDSGIQMNDPSLDIQWEIPPSMWIRSEKDTALPLLKNYTL